MLDDAYFLSYGIEDAPFLLAPWPLLIASAQSNPVVGLSRVLMILIDLMELLHVDGFLWLN